MTPQQKLLLTLAVVELLLGAIYARGQLKAANKALRTAQEEYWMRRGARGINRGLLK